MMMKRTQMRPLWPVLLSCGLICAASSALAQDIIRFDDQAGGKGSPTYPGMPAQSAPQADAPPASVSKAGDESKDDGYNDSTVFRTPQGEAGSAQTQELLRKEPKEIYSGIIPGKRDEVKHIEATEGPSEITWIGFLAEKTRTRVFIQTKGSASYATSKVDNKLTFTFSNSSLAAKNFSRFIDTRFYGRVVRGIETTNKKKQKTVAITLTLDGADEPRIDQQGEYIYVDFKYSPKKKGEDDAKDEADR
jgi:hypothetical protein